MYSYARIFETAFAFSAPYAPDSVAAPVKNAALIGASLPTASLIGASLPTASLIGASLIGASLPLNTE